MSDRETTPAALAAQRIAARAYVPAPADAAYQEGYRAMEMRLRPSTDNPHPAGTLRAEWHRGWEQAMHDVG